MECKWRAAPKNGYQDKPCHHLALAMLDIFRLSVAPGGCDDLEDTGVVSLSAIFVPSNQISNDAARYGPDFAAESVAQGSSISRVRRLLEAESGPVPAPDEPSHPTEEQ